MKREYKWLLGAIVISLAVWFLNAVKGILAPFILAGIFAYLLDPAITYCEKRLRLRRSISVIAVFVFVLGLLLIGGSILAGQAMDESVQLRSALSHVDSATKEKIATFPLWLQPFITEGLTSLEKSKYFSASSIVLFFPQVITKLFSVLIFLFSSFYLLKDGRFFFTFLLRYFPQKKREDVVNLSQKIHEAFGKYLRGQILLIIFVSIVLFVGLTILGIRYALLLAIFSGFAELAPIIGPIIAGGVAIIVGVFYGSSMTTDPAQIILYVALLYFILRQIQDYFVTPYILGKVTRLHPLVVLFSVIVGGHLYGVLGLVLAVPVAAIMRILFEYFFLENLISDKKGALGNE